MPSRISGACTPCRSKKQKCSGHHPTCSQCANASIDCTWPEQRKRGPAKGYIEALESRLHSAESLLLSILPLISDNVVERAVNVVHHENDEDAEGLQERRSSPPLLNKKTGLDYWESFPLDTKKNIRKWQFHCEASSGGNAQYTTRDSSAVSRTKFRSPSNSPRSGGIASPRGSTSAVSQQSNWIPTMQPYVPQNQIQAGAQQLLSLSNQRRDHWMATQPSPDTMQLDPNLMQPGHHHHHPHQHQPQQLPHPTPHMYAGNIQQSLFW